MIVRIVRMSFRPECTNEFMELFNSYKDRIRNFPGCQHLELHRDLHDMNVYCTYSHWIDAADLEAYRNSDLFAEVWPATKALFAAKPFAFSNTVIESISED